MKNVEAYPRQKSVCPTAVELPSFGNAWGTTNDHSCRTQIKFWIRTKGFYKTNRSTIELFTYYLLPLELRELSAYEIRTEIPYQQKSKLFESIAYDTHTFPIRLES